MMIETLTINDKQVWIKVSPLHVDRKNPNVIPTEYFTVSYFTKQPQELDAGEIIKDENNEPKLFESPVAAINFAAKKLETIL